MKTKLLTLAALVLCIKANALTLVCDNSYYNKTTDKLVSHEINQELIKVKSKNSGHEYLSFQYEKQINNRLKIWIIAYADLNGTNPQIDIRPELDGYGALTSGQQEITVILNKNTDANGLGDDEVVVSCKLK